MESKTYVFNPESGTSGTGSNGILAMLPALMQRQGVDPGLIALLNNRGNGNGWGEDIFAILLLFILMGNNGMGFFGGNRCMGSNGQGGVVPMLNNDANTAVIMQAVQRNGFDVQSLATALNTSSDAVMAAINGLGHQICNLGNQMGMNARQSSLFYILDKGGEKPTLKIGQVISVSNPQQKYPSYMPGQTPTLETTVDVKVQVEDQQVNFEKLPSTAQIVNFGNEGVVVSDSREAMCAEIDAMLRHSKGVVESVDYHNGVISSCEEMLTRINPQIAKEKQQEKDISNLKSEVSGMKGTLSNIESMLSKALSGNNFKK